MEKSQVHKTYFALLFLLLLTAVLAQFSLGNWGIALALGIAMLKAILILLVFMKLGETGSKYRIFALAGIVWLSFLLLLTASDYLTRNLILVPGK
jgi:cytochrome c oxidase subunit 4